MSLQWLAPSAVDRWRRGGLPFLIEEIHVGPDKLATALQHFHTWARERGLRATETTHLAHTRDRHRLRFTEDGSPEVERLFAVQWAAPSLPPEATQRLVDEENEPPEPVVFWPRKAFTCSGCGEVGSGFLLMDGGEPLCMTCAELDHLVFLPAGDAGLTRRARRASSVSAVVVRFSTTRKRYERQGLLVEEAALTEAHSSTSSTRSATES